MFGLRIYQEHHRKEMYLACVEKQEHLFPSENSPPAASSEAARRLFAFNTSSDAGQPCFSDLFTPHG